MTCNEYDHSPCSDRLPQAASQTDQTASNRDQLASSQTGPLISRSEVLARMCGRGHERICSCRLLVVMRLVTKDSWPCAADGPMKVGHQGSPAAMQLQALNQCNEQAQGHQAYLAAHCQTSLHPWDLLGRCGYDASSGQ